MTSPGFSPGLLHTPKQSNSSQSSCVYESGEGESGSCWVETPGWSLRGACALYVIPDKWWNYPMCWHVEGAGPLSTPISRRWITRTRPFITAAAEQDRTALSDTHKALQNTFIPQQTSLHACTRYQICECGVCVNILNVCFQIFSDLHPIGSLWLDGGPASFIIGSACLAEAINQSVFSKARSPTCLFK